MGKIIVVFLIFILVVCCFIPANAQSGTVIRKKDFLGIYQYHQNGRKFSEEEFMEVLEHYPQSYNLMQSARKNFLWGSLIGVSGAVLVYSQIDPINPFQERHPAILITGLALFGASIPLNIKYIRQSRLAMDQYNEAQFKSGYFRPKPELQLGFTSSGLGLQLKF